MRIALLALLLLTQAPAVVAPKLEPLSQVEKLRVENLKLERVILQRSVADWQAKAMALKADMEKARDHKFVWNPDEDTWAPVPKETK